MNYAELGIFLTFFLLKFIPNRIATAEIKAFDLVRLLWPDALPATNLPKEENAQRRFFAHTLPEILLLFVIEARWIFKCLRCHFSNQWLGMYFSFLTILNNIRPNMYYLQAKIYLEKSIQGDSSFLLPVYKLTELFSRQGKYKKALQL